MSRRFLFVLAALVLAWYLGLTNVPLLAGTCLDGDCGFTVLEIVVSVAIPLVFTLIPVVMEMVWQRRSFADALVALGLTRVSWPGVPVALIFAVPLLTFFPLVALITQFPLATRPGWQWLLLGVFLTNGLAEETMMRGFVFRHLRERASFWKAAAISTLYFAGYHLPLLVTQGPAVGIASVVLAVPTGFLTAYAYDRGKNTLAGPAIIHVVNNGLVYVFVFRGDAEIVATSLYILTGALTGTLIVLFAWRTRYGRTPEVVPSSLTRLAKH